MWKYQRVLTRRFELPANVYCLDSPAIKGDLLVNKEPRGHEVFRFEQRGCGRSDRTGRYDVGQCVADVEALRAYFGVERWIVGGHSWGANLALAYALGHPKRARALLYLCGNGVQNDRDWSAEYHRALDERGEQLPEMAFEPNLEVNEQVVDSWRRFVRRPELLAEIAALDLAALIVLASEDIRPGWPAEQLALLLPRARRREIVGAPHAIWLTHGDELRSCLRDFLDGAIFGA